MNKDLRDVFLNGYRAGFISSFFEISKARLSISSIFFTYNLHAKISKWYFGAVSQGALSRKLDSFGSSSISTSHWFTKYLG
ncbi:unnamed protein product [Meloidogyne enterolobii]|uniref:Uncharacterized protein n=1 Tax=Meloidogyne enterolobii TaxID=390850 RepID=A0ACB0Y679_MELEN